MENKIVFNRYGTALFLNESIESIDNLREQLLQIQEILMNNDELKNFFATPVFSKKEKYDFIDSLKNKVKLSDNLSKFLKIIIKNGRGFYFLPIIEEAIDVANSLLNVKIIYCYLAMELSDAKKKKLKSVLEKRVGCKVSIKYIIDTSIIGGMKLFIDDHLIDGSVKTENKSLRKRVIGG